MQKTSVCSPFGLNPQGSASSFLVARGQPLIQGGANPAPRAEQGPCTHLLLVPSHEEKAGALNPELSLLMSCS